MKQESNPIDKKSLIIYSLILVVVIVVSAIFITPGKKSKSTPAVKTAEVPVEVGSGTTEINGYKIKGGWQVYKGAVFDINYPNGYTPKVLVTNDIVSFTSSDSQRKLIVYGPLAPGSTPAEFTVNDATETVTDSISGKNPTCNALFCSREITVVEAKDKSYARKILVSKNNADKTTSAFSFQYQPGTADSIVTDIFNNLQESLAKHAK